jgi:hypothetical protein
MLRSALRPYFVLVINVRVCTHCLSFRHQLLIERAHAADTSDPCKDSSAVGERNNEAVIQDEGLKQSRNRFCNAAISAYQQQAEDRASLLADAAQDFVKPTQQDLEHLLYFIHNLG